MVNVVFAVILLVIIGLAVRYIIKAKKSGQKCIGCPESCCPHKGEGGCGGACSGCKHA